jgi:steroid delta-isomerase-like uncharacterized protein
MTHAVEDLVASSASLEQLATELLARFNQHDAEGLARLYAEDQVTICSGEAEPIRGRAAKARFVGHFFQAFPDMHLDPSSILYTGDRVVLEVNARGTNTGPIDTPDGEIPPTGNAIDMMMIFVIRVGADGLIREDRTYFDTAEFMGQLGLLA